MAKMPDDDKDGWILFANLWTHTTGLIDDEIEGAILGIQVLTVRCCHGDGIKLRLEDQSRQGTNLIIATGP